MSLLSGETGIPDKPGAEQAIKMKFKLKARIIRSDGLRFIASSMRCADQEEQSEGAALMKKWGGSIE
jgi:uncharacterized lipoprotein YbaY